MHGYPRCAESHVLDFSDEIIVPGLDIVAKRCGSALNISLTTINFVTPIANQGGRIMEKQCNEHQGWERSAASSAHGELARRGGKSKLLSSAISVNGSSVRAAC
jgi:hypothetical protein